MKERRSRRSKSEIGEEMAFRRGAALERFRKWAGKNGVSMEGIFVWAYEAGWRDRAKMNR